MLAAEEIAARLRRGARTRSRGRQSVPDAQPMRSVWYSPSKTQPPDAVRAAYHAGARDFGENYIREAAAKRAELARLDRCDVASHRTSAEQQDRGSRSSTFEIIQTLDSARLADAIAHAQPSPPMRVLIEVNLGGEPSKSGVGSERR